MDKQAGVHERDGLRNPSGADPAGKETKIKTIQVEGVYDIETSGWTQFVCGGVLTRGGFHSFTYRKEDEFVDLMLSLEGRYFAHNGGKFDVLWFLNHVRKRGLKATCYAQGQRLTNVRIGKLVLCDSYALIPMALEKGAELGRYRKSTTGLECECGESCGGYCAINRTMSVAAMRRLIDYMELDCKALLSMLDGVIDFADRNDLDLQYTIGGSSWATARRWLGLPKADWSWGKRGQSASSLYQFARQAYFGGRTQVFRPLAETGWRYDINSAYPYALSTLALPTGVARELWGSQARRAWASGEEGLYRARVWIPECHIPPLPTRGHLRLVYPTGQVNGIWPANELRYAEEVGCRIQRIDAGLCWDSSSVVFASLCKHVWDLRDKAGAKTALGAWLKWFANSLTGRLAIRPEGETIIIGNTVSAGLRFCPQDWDCKNGSLHSSTHSRCCQHRCTKRCGATLPLGDWGQGFGVYVKSRWQIADSAHVHYAAYLTAHARIALHRQLTDDGAGGYSAVYCDTDSVYSVVERVNNVGLGFGQFKPEGTFEPRKLTDIDADALERRYGFVSLAPKTYRMHSVTIDGESKTSVASKGVEANAVNFARLIRGESVTTNRGVKSIRSASRDGDFFVRKSITRSVLGTEDINGVRWFGDRWLADDGVTHPQHNEGKNGRR
jgi:hypothetical protein